MRLIEQAWYENHPIKWLLLPLNLLFWTISTLRRVCYKLNVFKQPELPLPVIVVGNIGVGGNGKTPIVLYLVEHLKAKGINVGVISRGYGGEKRQQPKLIDSNTTAEEAGDEPVLIFQRTNVPVVVSPDRVENIKALHKLGCQLVISDDGLQHYRMRRNVELVIVDGNRRFGNGWLMPAGPLREGLWRLNTVDKVIVNGGVAQPNELKMQLRGVELVNVVTDERISIDDFFALKCPAKNVNAIAGIGNPSRFFNSLQQLGFSIGKSIGFVDHHHFEKQDFHRFDDSIPLLMTEKDAVKCRNLVASNTWYLPVNAYFALEQGEQLIELIIKRSNIDGF